MTLGVNILCDWANIEFNRAELTDVAALCLLREQLGIVSVNLNRLVAVPPPPPSSWVNNNVFQSVQVHITWRARRVIAVAGTVDVYVAELKLYTKTMIWRRVYFKMFHCLHSARSVYFLLNLLAKKQMVDGFFWSVASLNPLLCGVRDTMLRMGGLKCLGGNKTHVCLLQQLLKLPCDV
jgi:hypothetical protein